MTVESIRRIDPDVVERMAALMPWHYTEFGQNGLTYQTCRFCHQGIGDAPDGLWKYGVRHYVCTACRDAITSQRLANSIRTSDD